jgi:anti-sigma factor RsiW
MCPEFEILSAYFDGEINSPWAATIEAHCVSCEKCSAQLASLARLRESLRTAPEPDMNVTLLRVRKKISQTLEKRSRVSVPFWMQSIRIPIPVFALSVLLIVAFGVLFFFNKPSTGLNTATANTLKDSGVTQQQITAPSSGDVEALLKSLEQMGSPQDVVIKLPEGSHFDTVGEPALIHSVDYKGNQQ